MHSYIFGKPNSSVKTKTIEAPSLEDAILEFRTTELYPELYVSKDFVTGREERPYPYSPLLTVSADAVIEVCEVIKGERNVLTLLAVSDVLNAPLTSGKQHLLPGSIAHDEDALTAAENSPSLSFTKQNARKKMDALIEQKFSLEKQMEALNEQIQAMEKKLQNAAKTLRLMKNYAGIDAELVRIRDGEAASEDTPLSVYQQKLFMDENVGILDLLSGGTESLDIHNLEEFDKWIAIHYKTFMPAEKALTVWQIRRNSKEYIQGNSFETSFFNRILNEGNFQTYFFIRNGEKLWRFTSDFHVPDAVFPKKTEKHDWFTASREKEDAEKRLFALAALQGIIDHTDILGTRLREEKVNLLSPDVDEKDVVFIRDAEPDQYITDGKPRWRDYLAENQKGIRKGSRIMPLKTYWDITRPDGTGDRWEWTRSASQYTRVTSVPDASLVYEVQEVIQDGWCNMIKILFNPGDEIYRYRGNWVSDHKRMRRIGFLYYNDEVVDVDAVSLEDIEYYLTSRLDRKDYMKILPVLFRLYMIKKRSSQ